MCYICDQNYNTGIRIQKRRQRQQLQYKEIQQRFPNEHISDLVQKGTKLSYRLMQLCKKHKFHPNVNIETFKTIINSPYLPQHTLFNAMKQYNQPHIIAILQQARYFQIQNEMLNAEKEYTQNIQKAKEKYEQDVQKAKEKYKLKLKYINTVFIKKTEYNTYKMKN